MKNVYVLTNGKKIKVGVAFVDKDGNLSINLDSLPVDGKLIIEGVK